LSFKRRGREKKCRTRSKVWCLGSIGIGREEDVLGLRVF